MERNVAEPDWRVIIKSNNETTSRMDFISPHVWIYMMWFKSHFGWTYCNHKSEETKESGIFIPYVGAVYDLNDQYQFMQATAPYI